MTDHEESDHWNLLASELGFTPPPKEEKKLPVSEEPPAGESEVPAKKAPSEPPARHAPRAPQPRRTSEEWRRLADQLGVVLDEEVAGPPPPEAKPLPALETPPAPATGEWPAIEPVTPQPAEDFAEPADTASTSADKRSGRRRRKRGRRPRGLPEGEPAEAASEAGEEEPDEELAEAADRQEASGTEATDSSATAGEKARPRRRRRGSGRKRGLAEREVEAAPPATGGEPSVPQAESASSQDNDRKSGTPRPGDTEKRAGDRKKERAVQNSKSGKVRHHAIPNWEEAIGIVIAANMEARTKSPNGGSSSRSRGGRGRGRRGKSSEKPN